jgi:CRP-like cAMP-binding protein
LRSLPRRTLKRRQIVSRVGDASTPLYYVESGLLRLSGIEGVRERTYQFALEGWWLTDWSGFEGPLAEFEIQAVEASQVVALTKEEHEQLLRDAPVLEGYFRRVF